MRTPSRSRDSARNSPIPSRSDTSAILAGYKTPVVRMNKLQVSKVETTNIRLRLDTGVKKGEETPTSSPYEERFLLPPVEEDVKLGPSYYSDRSYARAAGDSQEFPSRSMSMTDGEDGTMDADLIDGNNTEVCVTNDDEVLGEGEHVKRKQGRPATHGKFVGIREIREEEARQKKEAELEKRVKEALSSEASKGAKWIKILEKEEEMEEELKRTMTEDIAAQLLDHSAVLFKAADCSNKMKGSLVGKMKNTVALIRTATTVLTRRVRKDSGNEEFSALRKEMEMLCAENRELRGEVDKLKSAPPVHTSHAQVARRAAVAKRRRIVDSDSENEMSGTIRVTPLDLSNNSVFPSFSASSGEKGGRSTTKKEAYDGAQPDTMGPSLGGKARPLEPLLQGLSDQEKAAMLRLRAQRDDVLSLLGPILEGMDALEVSCKDKNLAKVPPTTITAPALSAVPPVIGKEAKAFNPQRDQRQDAKKVPPVAPTTTVDHRREIRGRRRRRPVEDKAQPFKDRRWPSKEREESPPPNPKGVSQAPVMVKEGRGMRRGLQPPRLIPGGSKGRKGRRSPLNPLKVNRNPNRGQGKPLQRKRNQPPSSPLHSLLLRKTMKPDR